MNDNLNINDALQQVPQLKGAIDDLRGSIVSLNKEMLNYNKQNQEAVDWGTKVKNNVKELVETYETFGKAIDILQNGFKGWVGILSASLTIITTYGAAFAKVVLEWAKGETKLTALGKAMKDNAILANALIQTKLNGDKAAQAELTSLKALYNATQSQNSSYQQKLDAAKALKEQWPETFGRLNEETIIAGNAAKAYGELKDRIMDTAYAEAAKNNIVSNASRILENEQKVIQERAKNLKIIRQQQIEQKKLDDMKPNDKDDHLTKFYRGSETNQKALKWQTDIVEEQKALRAASDKIIYDLTGDSKLLEIQNERFYHEIEKRVKSSGVGVLGYKTPAPTKPNSSVGNNDSNNTVKNEADTIGDKAKTTLDSYANEIEETNKHFDDLKKLNSKNSGILKEIEQQRLDALKQINDKFQQDGLEKLNGYQKQLQQIALENTQDAIEKLHLEIKQKTDELDKQSFEIVNRIANQQHDVEELKKQGKTEEAKILEAAIEKEMEMLKTAGKIREALLKQQSEKELTIQKDKAKEDEQKQNKDQQDSIDKLEQGGQHTKALQLQLSFLKQKHDAEISNSQLTHEQIKNLDEGYAKQKADIEDKLTESKIHAGDKYINAVLANSKKDSAIYKAAFMAKKATAIADVIISTKKGIIGSFEGYAHLPFIGQALAIAQAAIIAGQGAASIASIAQQKPGFAKGGHYTSDGKGALLPGYSRVDNTNAYLRSGEAVVVSEAMRNPWARNLVSAINVAHGGRDFSTRSTSRGYAIGGIFTDGGNANRYYNQPANDVKDLANTLAYQMINNFPPIYVDVKDVNNQQNILAQTVNRVDL